MCGRFTQHYTWQQIHAFLSVFGTPQNLQARYNIAPTTFIDIVRHDFEGRRELVRGVRWVLIPSWWKMPLKDLPATFNARVETVADKPMFRGAYRSRRCVVPASGFYEWTGPKGAKQSHIFWCRALLRLSRPGSLKTPPPRIKGAATRAPCGFFVR